MTVLHDRAIATPTLDLLPRAILDRIRRLPVEHDRFVERVLAYHAMDDDGLLRRTEICLGNLERVVDQDESGEADLQVVLVPELWERIVPGVRATLRRITSSLAEYQSSEASIFARLLGPRKCSQLQASASQLRARIAAAAELDAQSLVERVRFAIAGSRAVDRWAPTDHVYDPAFVYCLTPVLARRALDRSRSQVRTESTPKIPETP